MADKKCLNVLRVPVEERMSTKVDLLKAIQSQPLDKLKELINTKGIPADEKWLDYAAINCALEQGRKDVALFLLEKKCRVNKVSRLIVKPSSTPLHNAVKLGDPDLVQKLLDRNASMTATNSKGNSPLHLAFLLKHEKITDVILDFISLTATYANPKNDHGLTHFHIACARKNASLVLSYTKIKCNLNDIVNKDSPYFAGYTVMQFAVESKSPLILKLLLEHSGSVLKNQTQNALNLAEKYFVDMSVMVYMLSSYAQTKPQTTMSQFHIACMQNNPTLVNTFLDYGAAVNKPIREDASIGPLYTPLHYAVESNCKESVQILLQHGADVNSQNTYYMTPLHLGLYNDNQEIIEMLYASTKNKMIDRNDRNGLNYFHAAIVRNDIDVVEKFLDKGQDVNGRIYRNFRNFSGYTPLHFAVRYGHLRIARLLVERFANVNASDMGKHGTPLHIAVAAGNCGMINLLLKCNAKVNINRFEDNKNMLHLLVENYMDSGKRNRRLLEYVEKFVLGYGLDINAKDKEGYTPLHYACTKISIGAECVKVLLEFGADINLENKVGDTPFELSFYDVYRDNAEDYMLLYNHVKGLQILGLTVNKKNEECCEKLMREKDECQKDSKCFRPSYFVKKQQEFLNEILKMKELMISSKNISMYQFVQMNDNELKGFDGSGDALRSLIEGKLIRNFVNFGYLLRLQWCRLKKLRAMLVVNTGHF